MRKQAKLLLIFVSTLLAGSAYVMGVHAADPVSAPAAQPASKPASVVTSGVVSVDLPEGSAQSIRLDIKQGRFAEQSVGRLLLDAQNIDFQKGSLTGLNAEVQEGKFEALPVDSLKLQASGFSFDTYELLNHRRFVLDKPVQSSVQLKISEANLNKFLSNPKTIEKLEKAIAKKTGNVSLVNFSNPNLDLLGKNRFKLTLTTSIANAVGTPMEFNGVLGLNKNKVAFNNLQALSNGVELPVDIASVLQNKLNDMIDLEKLGKNTLVIQANDLVSTANGIEIKGTAALARLEFGK